MPWAFRVLFTLIMFPTLVINGVCQDKGFKPLLAYENIRNGYRFDYPSYLKRNQDQGWGQFVNPATNDSFFIISQFVPWDPKAYLEGVAILHETISHELINGRRWVTITSPTGKE